jgi:hypothetical protein
MDSAELRNYSERLRDRMCQSAGPKRRPKMGLAAITAARAYKAAVDAAAEARRGLAAAAVDHSPDPNAALKALQYLAESFGLPPFTADDVKGADGRTP